MEKHEGENIQWLIEPFNEKARNYLYEALKDQQGNSEWFKSAEGKKFQAWRIPNYELVSHMLNRNKEDGGEALFKIWRYKDYGKGRGKSQPENVTHLFLTKKQKLAKKIGRKIEAMKN